MQIEISVKLRSNGYLNKTKNRSRTTSRTVIYGDEGNQKRHPQSAVISTVYVI